MVTDEVLYSRVREGDRAALAELITRYHGPLLRFLYRMTNDDQIAEDIVQDTFVRLMTYEGKAPGRFRPWTFAIARNLTYDIFRSASYRREASVEMGDREWTPAPGPSVEATAARHADRAAVVAALQQLRPHHREVLVLRFYHDLSLREIAEIIGSPVGTVKSRLYHALREAKFRLECQEVLAP